jgi:heat shock protein HtpX
VQQAFGLYTHIQANRRRSIFLIGALFFLVYLLVFAGALLAEAVFDDASVSWLIARAWDHTMNAIPMATALTLVWIAIAYKYHQRMIDALTGGHPVSRAENPRLYNLLENLCIARGLPMPSLKVMSSPALNAFATGLNERQYAITVTTGLLESLDDAELEAVLAHELTHIRNGDVRMMVVAVVIAGVISFVAEIFFRGRFWWGQGDPASRSQRSTSDSSGKGSGGGIIAIVFGVFMIALAWGLSIVIRYALSRSREYLADAGSVELTKNPDAMITALRKIENRGELPGATSAVMELCVDNPRSGFSDLFATHPSVDARIKALVAFAGGIDPGPLPPPPEPPQHEQSSVARP